MNKDDPKSYYRGIVAELRAKLHALPATSQLRAALSDQTLADLDAWIEATDEIDLPNGPWPPTFRLVQNLAATALAELDQDLNSVLNASEPSRRSNVTAILRTQPGQRPGSWQGGLFDVSAKGAVLRSHHTAEFDVVLPNGRDCDMRLILEGRQFWIENTAITEDDESREIWDRFLRDKKLDPEKVLIRPGAYCPSNAKGPSPYYDALRLYAKIYDKLAKNMDVAKAQFPGDEPSVLLVSFSGAGISADSPAVGWVLDELFADQPRMVRTVLSASMTDISLDAWIDFTLQDRLDKGLITPDDFRDNFRPLMAAPRQLGGVILFDGGRLVASRLNYNANANCCITHGEMAALEEIFRRSTSYWPCC